MSNLEIWAATPTPYDAAGRVDPDVVAEQATRLLADGVDGVFVCGTTGEFPALSVDERVVVADAWSRTEGLRIGLHVGHSDLGAARELAAHAASCGADLIASVPPYYGEPELDRLVAHVAAIAAAAPDTDFCYYHIPSMTRSGYRVSDIIARAVGEIPRLTAMKFTHDDFADLDRLRCDHPRIRVFFGKDELLPAALAHGVDAVIGSLWNGLAPIARAVGEAFERDPAEAYRLHEPVRRVAETAGAHGGLGWVKELLNALGPTVGAPRSPWGPLPAASLAVAAQVALEVRAAVHELAPVPAP